MRKLIQVSAVSLAFLAPTAGADVLGFGASANYWHSSLTGDAVSGATSVDVENDLDLSSDATVNLLAWVEHPIPVLPNIRVGYTLIQQTGRGQVSAGGFDGIVGGAEVQSELDLEQLDLTLYYELLDNWVNLDGGLTLRRFEGDLLVEERLPGSQVSRSSIEGVAPMLFGAARFDIPTTDFSLGADGNVISFDGDTIYDVNAYGQFETSLVRIQLGYRRLAIDVSDGDDRLDVAIAGPFASAGISF